MIKVNLTELELTEFQGKNTPGQHCRATFPLLGAMGSKDTAMVYIELDPGDTLGRHTDSAEEVLLVLDGTVEASIGEERGELTKGEFALVPKMEPHNLRNIGEKPARIVGLFGGSADIVATFDEAWLPTESNVVDTAKISQQAEQVSA
jgi:quercetin dioxygenase-like cupin family protein